ncbi:hypothetical protein SAMN02745753_03376 [Marinomonas polaris DSM 16579]|jgi:hypothetical protein|uniref:Uncharacterized protein n=1 Tax=Marinomonas polaris DSM 16579 TaxID=1122206 RepID=A0A1M5HH09_9GAMM|nr:hypothetical protein SAMN02745753_03376 [Marinomonas polaris DSM 16579]
MFIRLVIYLFGFFIVFSAASSLYFLYLGESNDSIISTQSMLISIIIYREFYKYESELK